MLCLNHYTVTVKLYAVITKIAILMTLFSTRYTVIFYSIFEYHFQYFHSKQPKAEYTTLEAETPGSPAVYYNKGDVYYNTSSGGHPTRKACSKPENKKDPEYYNTKKYNHDQVDEEYEQIVTSHSQ